jgi:hypothetical protein
MCANGSIREAPKQPKEEIELQQSGLASSISSIPDIFRQEGEGVPLNSATLAAICQGRVPEVLALLCSGAWLGGLWSYRAGCGLWARLELLRGSPEEQRQV